MILGILGSGQLSQMMAESTSSSPFPRRSPLSRGGVQSESRQSDSSDLQLIFYDPNLSCPIEKYGTFINAPYEDEAELKRFIDLVDVVTYENENIPLQTLAFIEQYKPLHPGREPIRIMQDRLIEKTYLQRQGITTAKFFEVNTKVDALEAAQRMVFPLFLKTRRGGYDGRGQIKLDTLAAIDALGEDSFTHCILEQAVAFDREVSIIGCRDREGQMVFYDVCENEHREGILFCTRNRIDDGVASQARSYLGRVLEDLDYVGVCTMELFDVQGELVANEMAPRVHNSGHWTIEGAVTSQFENHVRAVIGLPLGDAQSYGEYVMVNILGEMPDTKALDAIPGVHWHDYKKMPRAKRKVGHVTYTCAPGQDPLADIEACILG